MKSMQVDDITHKRLQSLLNEFISLKQQDLDMNDFLNELIDNYQESQWGPLELDLAVDKNIDLDSILYLQINE